MLDSCRRRCAELNLAPNLFEDEMHHFSLPNQYEAIIIPGGSFQLIEGRECAIAALQHINSYLVPGGKLIMDLFIPNDWNGNSSTTRTWGTPNQEVILLEDKRIELNLLEQRMVSILKYEKWKDGNLIQTELQRFPISWYGKCEFEMLLEKLGYVEIVQSADYKYRSKPAHAEQMITYEARKAEV
jgi:hypothetical protein